MVLLGSKGIGTLARQSDIGLAIAVVGVLLVLIVPLPTALLERYRTTLSDAPGPVRFPGGG